MRNGHTQYAVIAKIMVEKRHPGAQAVEPEPVSWCLGGGLTGGEWVKVVDGDTVLGQGINADIAWLDAYRKVLDEKASAA
jgi:hypothetical protein